MGTTGWGVFGKDSAQRHGITRYPDTYELALLSARALGGIEGAVIPACIAGRLVGTATTLGLNFRICRRLGEGFLPLHRRHASLTVTFIGHMGWVILIDSEIQYTEFL